MGLEVDEDLSPAVMRKAVNLATKIPSFRSAAESVEEGIGIHTTAKHLMSVGCQWPRNHKRGSWRAVSLGERFARVGWAGH